MRLKNGKILRSCPYAKYVSCDMSVPCKHCKHLPKIEKDICFIVAIYWIRNNGEELLHVYVINTYPELYMQDIQTTDTVELVWSKKITKVNYEKLKHPQVLKLN